MSQLDELDREIKQTLRKLQEQRAIFGRVPTAGGVLMCETLETRFDALLDQRLELTRAAELVPA